MGKLLEKEDILRGLRAIDRMAREAAVTVDLSIYGGAALALAFNLRQATRDVDAVVHGSPDFLRKAVARIAEEEGWPKDWLNDGVKGFLSAHEKMRLMMEFSDTVSGGLRIHTPAPEYLFAMKCMAMRTETVGNVSDKLDIEALAHEIGIKDARTALEIVESFYPPSGIPPKVRFGVEEIMEKMQERRGAGAQAAVPEPSAAPKK